MDVEGGKRLDLPHGAHKVVAESRHVVCRDNQVYFHVIHIPFRLLPTLNSFRTGAQAYSQQKMAF